MNIIKQIDLAKTYVRDGSPLSAANVLRGVIAELDAIQKEREDFIECKTFPFNRGK